MAQSRQTGKGKTANREEQSGRSYNSANGVEGKPDKYRRILDAAVKVIAEKGFHNSRVSEIAERADVADGTIYLYFKSKDQILMAALDHGFQSFLQRAREEVAGASDPREKLRILARLHLRSLAQNRSMAVVLQTELRQSLKFLTEFSQREMKAYFNVMREIVREGQQAGVIRADVSDVIAASCLFGSLDELVTAWVLSSKDYDLAGSADPVVDLLLHGLEVHP
ncbi:MAG TPA: TetR/AcrR family transcriptional regulator [Terriglobales bacterium]|nr:TetR/AcrR family transcriptional regulator [Terriglobales bacterium]